MIAAWPQGRGLRVALLGTLVLLLAHAATYRFLCDDAYISFRYARNLAEGHGLVFNPGFERVEGFTNPIWVLLLAALAVVGARPEAVANVLSLGLTVVLWWLTVRASFALLPPAAPRWIGVLPVLWLAATRSVAVWSTGGLETRLFEVLLLGGVMGLVTDVFAMSRGEAGRRPWSAVALGLAAWTRPDGLLVGGAALATGAVVLAVRRRLRIRPALAYAGAFSGIVGLQLGLRLAYFGAWLPNTYYAKVDGRSWWEMGARYLGAFSLEYAAWLWIPLLSAGAIWCVRARHSEIPLIVGAALVPHALYVASIGGDHFEYRPLDLYFPFVFLLMAIGAASVATTTSRQRWLAAYAGVVVVGLVAIPCAAYRQFPTRYVTGFPGLALARLDASDYLSPLRDPLLALPGVRSLAQAHRSLTREMTRQFVGVRREEHVLFRESVQSEALYLRELLARGVIPEDTFIAIGSVGVIPYVSELRTFDRYGLTDAGVARLPVGNVRVMAHEKVATFDMARARGVDLWTIDLVHLLYRESDPRLLERVEEARQRGHEAVFADMGNGWWLLARPPSGVEALRRRMPRVAFETVDDDAAVERLGRRVVEAAGRGPEGLAGKAHALELSGRAEEGEAVWRALAAEGDPEALLTMARIDEAAGRSTEGLADLDRLLASRPGAAPGWYLRGVLLAQHGRPEEGVDSLRRALEFDPDADNARFALAVAYVLAGRLDDAERETTVLARRRPDLADKVRSAALGDAPAEAPRP